MGAVWGIRVVNRLTHLEITGDGEATGVGGVPIQPRDLPEEGALESEGGRVSLTWEPQVRKGIQGSAGAALRSWIFVFKAVEAMDVFEQGKFRVRVLTKRSLWLLCVGRTGSKPGSGGGGNLEAVAGISWEGPGLGARG